MKKLCIIMSALLVGVFVMAEDAMAIQYLPDLHFDNGGTAAYTASDGKLVINAMPLSLTFDGSTFYTNWLSSPTPDVDIYGAYVSGGYSPWYFGEDPGQTPDITIIGKLSSPPAGFTQTGTLLTGNVEAMELHDEFIVV